MRYRKARGHREPHDADDMTLEEKRKQWNINLANRTLENMFGHIDLDNDTDIVEGFRKQRFYNKYEKYTPQQLYEKAREYFENIVETNEAGISIIPDIEDFCMYAHMSRETFMQYRQSEDPDMQSLARNIANAIANCKKQSALQGTLNPTIFAIDMNNNHNYVQAKTELTVNQNVSLQQIEANIADIANRLPMDDE